MAEKLLLKIRCDGIDTANVITSAAGIASALWEEQPLSLRDDELSIVEQDPDEEEVFSHENDAAEDYDITGNGMLAVGSFIKASYQQMADLLGGKVSGTGADQMFIKSAKKTTINKAFRFRLKGGGYLIIPNAKGYVNLSANLGATDGRLKFPFSLRAIAQTGFDCDIILKAPEAVDEKPVKAPEAPAAGVVTEQTAIKSTKEKA